MTRRPLLALLLAAGATFPLCPAATPAQSPFAGLVDPHLGLASNGSVLVAPPVAVRSRDPFPGLAPSGPTARRFEDTGAAIDGAEPVADGDLDAHLAFLRSSAVNVKAIYAPDERVRTTGTTNHPFRSIVMITFSGGGCSGFLISPDTVATAGHCVHSGPGGTWKSNVRVYPGQNGSSSPYGSCASRKLFTVWGWAKSGSELYDYGAIKLACTVGNTTGWWGFRALTDGTLLGAPAVVLGYPNDKPLTQWKSFDRIAVTQARQLFYRNDTTGGMSGGPVAENHIRGTAWGIHTVGPHGSGSPHGTNNHGTRITSNVFDNLAKWIYAP